MDYELVFSVAGVLAMFGWVSLLASPLFPVWSDRIAGVVVPLVLSLGYLGLIVFFPADSGGFGDFREVTELFSNRQALLAGWIHFLAFDLLIGAWICRQARQDRVRFWMILPCLPLTFLFGPAGFVLFQGVRMANAALGSARRSEVN